MTDTTRCEPPEKLRATSGYHWLRRTDGCGITPPAIWTWRMPEAVWRAQGIERTPEDMHHEWVAAVAPPADVALHVAGHVLVPIEATTAMVVAAIERPDTSDNSNGLFYSAIYRAMIEAAQEREQRYEIAPTLVEIERAICCPTGTCTSPNNCYAEDHTRSYPVQIQDAAKAVAKLYRGN